MSIQVAIIDDHPMILEGLQNMLAVSPHIQMGGAYLNAVELDKGLDDNLPDVLLLDIQLPNRTGDEIVPDILKKYPELKILVLTHQDNVLYVYNMLKLGVHGYILKTAHPKTLVQAIEEVYGGNEFIDPMLADGLHEFMLRMKKESYLKPRLTTREKEILQHIADGDSSHDIAGKLFISIRTVEYYRLNILLKMDVKNTALLIKKALQMGLVK